MIDKIEQENEAEHQRRCKEACVRTISKSKENSEQIGKERINSAWSVLDFTRSVYGKTTRRWKSRSHISALWVFPIARPRSVEHRRTWTIEWMVVRRESRQ